ncbi:hypothetical protein FS837_006388 [Tulasnella sp. UAMH 9824]|nr:hypothetical protein FS837_006388 [Tulasnella sp. UAMH 9824]
MSSQSAGRQPPTNFPPGPHNPARSTETSISDKVDAVKSTILDILKVLPSFTVFDLLLTVRQDTTWPRRSTNAALDLARVIDDNESLKNIPKDEAHMSQEHLNSLERLVNIMETAKTNVQNASHKFGARERKLGSKIKYVFTYLDRNECTEILKACEKDVGDALAALPDQWNFQAAGGGNHQQSTNVGTGTRAIPLLTPGAPSASLAGDQGVPVAHSTAPTATSQTPSAPVSAQNQQTTAPEDSATTPSNRGKWLSAIKTTLDTIEAASGAIPVAGSYVGAAAKVGNIVVQMVQNMDSNNETAKDLGEHAARLSHILNSAQDGSIQQQKEQMTACMSDVQQELQSLRIKLEELDSMGSFNKAFFSKDHAEAIKGHKEKIRTALEVMQANDGIM